MKKTGGGEPADLTDYETKLWEHFYKDKAKGVGIKGSKESKGWLILPKLLILIGLKLRNNFRSDTYILCNTKILSFTVVKGPQVDVGTPSGDAQLVINEETVREEEQTRYRLNLDVLANFIQSSQRDVPSPPRSPSLLPQRSGDAQIRDITTLNSQQPLSEQIAAVGGALSCPAITSCYCYIIETP